MTDEERQLEQKARRMQTQAGMFAFAMVLIVMAALSIGFEAGRAKALRDNAEIVEAFHVATDACDIVSSVLRLAR